MTTAKRSSLGTYPQAQNLWRFRARSTGFERVEPLSLSWEVRGDPISDDFLPTEVTAGGLFRVWLDRYGDGPSVPIYWSVLDVGEAAPFQLSPHDGDNFLTYWTEPLQAETSEPVNWVRLPVLDKRWSLARVEKGGFIQEATSWKPSPLQPTVSVRLLGLLHG